MGKSQKRRSRKSKSRKSKSKSIPFTGEDVYSLRNKKICGKRFNLYFNEVFASSNYFVYSLCRDYKLKHCKETLAKVYKIGRKTVESIEQEASFMKIASDLEVSPKFLGVEYCEYDGVTYGILIMSHYGQGSLTQLLRNGYYDEHKESVNKELRTILDTLYDNQVDHNDLHSDNFLYRFTENGIEFKIIDFDNSMPLKQYRNYTIEDVNSNEYISV
jgi:hypothetical protein